MIKQILTTILICNFISLAAQNPVMPTRAEDRDLKAEMRKDLTEQSMYAQYPTTNIGPTVMSGRVTDLDVNPINPTEFYVAYATGGLWYTNNNGTTFKPIFDDMPVLTIGDIAVDWISGTIYVGTGEVNSSRSSYAGNGIYKSEDKGESWVYLGLPESHHIGRILIDKSNTQRISVAVLGHLYSPNPERGMYLSEDGGTTWIQTLFINENTGGIDLIQDPKSTATYYAATWERERRAWNFVESGAGSGIYKSTDGAKTWKELSTPESGFPTGQGTGRIGLALSYEDNEPYLYAFLDNYNRRSKKDDDEKSNTLEKDDFKKLNAAEFAKISDDDLQAYLDANRFPEKYSAESVKKQIASGQINPNALAEYIEDANALLFDTDVKGAEVYLSKDGGATFTKTHDEYIDRLVNSYGYYFGQIRTEPNDPAVLYIMGVPILRSDDYGKSWKNVNGENVHVDHHALWINPLNSDHIINGNDGGVNISYDKGENWVKCNSPAVGQFYAINVDNAKPYKVYAGAQDNGVWTGKSNYKHNVRWHQSGQYPYKSLMGGDGMQIQIDNRDNNTTYTGFQFGNYFRINQSTRERSYITPKHELGDRPYRWNWQSPILLSSHNQDILYMGANKLLRSMDQGESFIEISEDLTNGGKKGDVAYGTLVTIDESTFKFGKILVGSDDGRLHLTTDGGNSWKDLGSNIPPNRWVSRALFSSHKDSTLYVSLNGYRWDDFNAYLYKSEDDGNTWIDLGQYLPTEPINVIKEDPSNPNVLYVGTDHGLYISINGGSQFQRLTDEMPHVPVHDIAIQKRENDLLVGTHGRSIYKIDLDPILKSIEDQALKVYAIGKIRYNSRWGSKSTIYNDPYTPEIDFYVFAPQKGKALFKIKTKDGKLLRQLDIDLNQGLASYSYDLSITDSNKKQLEKYLNKDKKKADRIKLEPADDGKIYLHPGLYELQINHNGQITKTEFEIENKD